MVKLIRDGDKLYLTAKDPLILSEVIRHKEIKPLLAIEASADSHSTTLSRIEINADARGQLKQILNKIFYPVEDLAGYDVGTPLSMTWRPETLTGDLFALRSYQQEAVATFHQQGSVRGGSGVLVLPCGSGKTVIGIGVMLDLQCETLILTTNNSAVKTMAARIG